MMDHEDVETLKKEGTKIFSITTLNHEVVYVKFESISDISFTDCDHAKQEVSINIKDKTFRICLAQAEHLKKVLDKASFMGFVGGDKPLEYEVNRILQRLGEVEDSLNNKVSHVVLLQLYEEVSTVTQRVDAIARFLDSLRADNNVAIAWRSVPAEENEEIK